MRTKCLGEKRPPSCSSLSSLSHWSRPSASPNTVQWLNASCEHRPCREQANLSVLVDVYMKVLWETLRLLYSLYMTVCERERMCVWVNFIGAQTFLLALKNKKKKNSLHKCQIFLGLLTACKFLWTQNVVFLGQKKKLCVSLWAVLNEFVDERERERKRPLQRNRALFELFWWSWYVRFSRAREGEVHSDRTKTSFLF